MFKLNFTKWIEYNKTIKLASDKLFEEELDTILEEKLLPVINKKADEANRKLRFAYYLKNSIYDKPLFYYDLTENSTISGCRCELCKTSNQCKHIILGMRLEKSNYNDDLIEELFIKEEDRLNQVFYEQKRKQYLDKVNPLLDEFKEYDQLSLLSKVDLL